MLKHSNVGTFGNCSTLFVWGPTFSPGRRQAICTAVRWTTCGRRPIRARRRYDGRHRSNVDLFTETARTCKLGFGPIADRFCIERYRLHLSTADPLPRQNPSFALHCSGLRGHRDMSQVLIQEYLKRPQETSARTPTTTVLLAELP
jgi:hypothetical protein